MRRGWLQSLALVVGLVACSGGGFSGADGDAEGGSGGAISSGGKAGGEGGASGSSAEGAQGGDVSAAGAGAGEGVAGAGSGECDTIYVSPAGDDGSDGCLPESPKQTLANALSAALEAGGAPRSVKACAGTYPEPELLLDGPVALLGGFDCVSFERDTQFGFDKDFASELESVIEDTDPELGLATLTISGDDVTSDALVEGFTIRGAVNGSVASAGVLVTAGAAPVLRHNRIDGGEGKANGVPSIGVRVEEAAAPELAKNEINGGAGETQADARGSIGLLLQSGAGIARVHDNRIFGGNGSTASSVNPGSVGVLVRAAGPFTGAAALRANDIDGGTGSGSGSTGVVIEGQVTAEIIDNRISAGAGVWNGSAAKLSCLGLIATQTVSLVVHRNRVYGGDCDAEGTLQVVTEGLIAFEADGVAFVNNLVHGGNISSMGGYSRGVILTGAPDALVVGNTILAGQSGPGVSAAGPDNSIALLLTPGTTGAVIVNNLILTSQSGKSSGVYVNDACSPSGIARFGNNALFGIGPLGIVMGAGCTTSGTYTGAAAFQTGLVSAMVGQVAASGNRQISSACSNDESSCVLRPLCTTPLNCLKDTFAEFSDDVGFTTLFGGGYRFPVGSAACALTQGGLALPDAGDDAFGVVRSAPFSIGAHEQDGACAAQ